MPRMPRASLTCTNPYCVMNQFPDQVQAIGFSGVPNFPTVDLIDGAFGAKRVETGKRLR